MSAPAPARSRTQNLNEVLENKPALPLKADAPQPELKSWGQRCIAFTMYFLSDRDGICRKFQREIASHTTFDKSTANHQIRAMVTDGAVIEVEPGDTNRHKPIPKGYKLHPTIRALFPVLLPHQKQKIREMISWELQPGFRIAKFGKCAGQKLSNDSVSSQNWMLRIIAMNMAPDLTTDLSAKQMAAKAGFKRKSKASRSSATLILRDLERSGRIARNDRFDEHTGRYISTVTRLAGESSFIPAEERTGPGTGKHDWRDWPPDPSKTNAAKVYQFLFQRAGIGEWVDGYLKELAPLAFPDRNLKSAKQAFRRGAIKLEQLGILECEGAGRGNFQTPYRFKLISKPSWLTGQKTSQSMPEWKLTSKQHERLHLIAEGLEDGDLKGFVFGLDQDKDFIKLCLPDYPTCSAAYRAKAKPYYGRFRVLKSRAKTNNWH